MKYWESRIVGSLEWEASISAVGILFMENNYKNEKMESKCNIEKMLLGEVQLLFFEAH